MADISNYAPMTGNFIKSDGTIVNLADLMQEYPQESICINKTATTTEASYTMNTNYIYLMQNCESSGGNLIIALDKSTNNVENNYFELSPGEAYKAVGDKANIIWVRSTSGNVKFRCYGKKATA